MACRMFNARSETVPEKSVFSRLLSSKRCIILLNGFYEWAQVRRIVQLRPFIQRSLISATLIYSESPIACAMSKKNTFTVTPNRCDGMQEHKVKQPYYVHYDDDRVMAMAGLYDNRKDAEGNWLTTFTILTTDSSQKLQW